MITSVAPATIAMIAELRCLLAPFAEPRMAPKKGSVMTSNMAMWLALAKKPVARPKLLCGYRYQGEAA